MYTPYIKINLIWRLRCTSRLGQWPQTCHANDHYTSLMMIFDTPDRCAYIHPTWWYTESEAHASKMTTWKPMMRTPHAEWRLALIWKISCKSIQRAKNPFDGFTKILNAHKNKIITKLVCDTTELPGIWLHERVQSFIINNKCWIGR